MTKLTRTMLSKNPELKVGVASSSSIFAGSCSVSEKVGEFDADGTGMEIDVLFE